MSQQVFADRIGKSKSWVDKVERGVRRLDKYSVLNEIAGALNIDAQQLLGREPTRRPDLTNCIDHLDVESIRQSLERYERLGIYLTAAAIEPTPIPELRKSVAHCWYAYENGNYPALMRSLIDLLNATPMAEENSVGGTKAEAASLLTQVYQIASTVLRKVGEPQLSWLAADRAIGAAQRCDDPLLVGIATTRVANALRSMGRFVAALDLNIQVAHGLITDAGAEPRPEELSVYGALLLQGAMAAALSGDSVTAGDLLNSAERAATMLGHDANYYWTSFGPTNVQLHRAAAAVELGEGRKALHIHEGIDKSALATMVPERRAHHYLDLARGCTQIGDMTLAGRAIVTADRAAPAEIRCRPLAQELAIDILRRSAGPPSLELRRLAEGMGIAA